MAGALDGRFWLAAGAAALAAPGLAAPAGAETVASRHADHVLGASFELAAAGAEDGLAALAADAALAEIARLDRVLSGWRGDSELAALNCSNTFAASPDLFAVIAACERWRAAAHGGFSARLGHARELWRDAAFAQRAPDLRDAAALAAAAECATVTLDPHTRRIARPDEVVFDIDGLAKGYILDCALKAARAAAPAAQGLLINIGGDIRAWSAPARAQPWRLAAADPAALYDNAAPIDHVLIWNGALAMSGKGARDYLIAGEAASHLIDPRSGAPAARIAGAAAIAPSAADADALASAFAVLAPRQSLALADRSAGVGALIVTADGDEHRSAHWAAHRSAHWAAPAAPCQAAPAAPAAPGGEPWPQGFAFNLSFEIPENAAANYRRPYVAVWISDENRRLVRTLLVLGPEARWREQNYVFWRRFERYGPEAVAAAARPTRAPGRYDLVWDGRDESGAQVGRGRYVLNIEASREHGGHSIQSIPIELGGAAASFGAEASQELGAARARYGR